MAWNRDHATAPAPATALDWSITAMTEAAGRLARARAWDLPRAVAAVSEATWWVTVVDATLVRATTLTSTTACWQASPANDGG